MAAPPMPKLRREIGFLTAVARLEVGALFWPEGVLSLVVGGGGGAWVLSATKLAERDSLVGDSVEPIGVLMGVVFAAYALLVALLSDDYVKLLDEAEGGIAAFLHPFMFAAGLQVATMFLTLGYRASAAHLPSRIEHGAFVVWAVLLSFTLLDLVALARNVSMHGLMRARQMKSR